MLGFSKAQGGAVETLAESQCAVSSRPGGRKSEKALFSLLRRLGRARDFDRDRFESELARAGPRRPVVLARLLADWVATSLSPRRSDRVWTTILALFEEMRQKLGSPLSLQTVLLHHFHSREGLLLDPRLLGGRDLERLHVSAITDPLTGLYNRRFLSESLNRYISRLARSGDPIAVAMLDIERFKSINDRYGHSIGDRALMRVAGVIRESLRPGDVACRWGGDEFFLLLPNAALLAAVAIAERIRRRLATQARPVRAGLALDFYYGVASFPLDGRNESDLIAAADTRLYQCREQRGFGGGDRRRYPRFAFQRMQLRLLASGRGKVTASVVNAGYGGRAFQ